MEDITPTWNNDDFKGSDSIYVVCRSTLQDNQECFVNKEELKGFIAERSTCPCTSTSIAQPIDRAVFWTNYKAYNGRLLIHPDCDTLKNFVNKYSKRTEGVVVICDGKEEQDEAHQILKDCRNTKSPNKQCKFLNQMAKTHRIDVLVKKEEI